MSRALPLLGGLVFVAGLCRGMFASKLMPAGSVIAGLGAAMLLICVLTDVQLLLPTPIVKKSNNPLVRGAQLWNNFMGWLVIIVFILVIINIIRG